MNREKYIVVMGTMGVGKTTATRALSEGLGFAPIFENFVDNPYLAKFYEHPRRYAYLSQRYFLEKKIEQMVEAARMLQYQPVVHDAYIAEDMHSYARAHVDLGNMSIRQWQQYVSVYEARKPELPEPDLIVFLKADVGEIANRIRSRDRDFETQVDVTYLQLLDRLNHEWLQSIQNTFRTLIIPTDNLNIADSPVARDEFVNRVKTALPLSGTIYHHEQII